MNYLKHIVVDNFFDNFNLIEHSFKNIPLFKLKDFNNRNPHNKQNWPGSRSDSIEFVSPFLFNLFNKEFNIKIGDVFKDINVRMMLHTHLRIADDSQKDWMHRDLPYLYSCLVYLSKTNMQSGTYLYSEDNEIISDIKFIQNRAIFFDSRYLHSAYGHHGSSIEDGRLTLNAFYEKV